MMYGGDRTAFDLEEKIRYFVTSILMYSFKGDDLRVDGEIE
jgi:hypothetical protein